MNIILKDYKQLYKLIVEWFYRVSLFTICEYLDKVSVISANIFRKQSKI